MGFLDKLKEGADQAKELAGQAVDRAKEEAKELSLKRQIAAAEGELGRAAFDLVDEGAVSHPTLTAPAEKVRKLRAELDTSHEAEATADDGGAAGEGDAAAAEPATEASSPSGGPETGADSPADGEKSPS